MAKGTFRTNGVLIDDNGDIQAIQGDTLILREDNGAAALSIDTDGNVIIPNSDINGGTIDGTTIGGTTPAAGKFNTLISTGDTSIENSSPSLRIKDTNAANATELAATVRFIDNTNTETGYVGYGSLSDADFRIINSASGGIKFATNNIERVEIDSSGNVELKTTNANLILPTGGGISFENHSVSSASGASSTASDNVLDDYEEGEFSGFSFGSNTYGGSASYFSTTNRSGYYRKVGSIVHLWFAADFEVLQNVGGNQALYVFGLPFSGSNIAGYTTASGIVTEDTNPTISNFIQFPDSGTSSRTGYLIPSTGTFSHRLRCTMTYFT